MEKKDGKRLAKGQSIGLSEFQIKQNRHKSGAFFSVAVKLLLVVWTN